MLMLLAYAFGSDPSTESQLDDSLRRARSLLKAAKSDDVACIEPKVAMLEGMRALIQPVEVARARAESAGDTLHAEAEARKLAVIRSKIARYLEEAEACVEVAQTTASVDEPGEDVEEDFVTPPPPDIVTPCGSCY